VAAAAARRGAAYHRPCEAEHNGPSLRGAPTPPTPGRNRVKRRRAVSDRGRGRPARAPVTTSDFQRGQTFDTETGT